MLRYIRIDVGDSMGANRVFRMSAFLKTLAKPQRIEARQEKQRQEEEAKNPKVDAYHLPLAPVEPPPPPPPANDASPPVARESNQ